MRIELQLDGIRHNIDSRNPETLARWLIEQFSSHNWTPATYCRVQVWPSFGYISMTGRYDNADWITDTRYRDLVYSTTIRSPQEILDAMQEALNDDAMRR